MKRAASIPPGAIDSYAVSGGFANSVSDANVGETVVPSSTATAMTAHVRREPRKISPKNADAE